MKRSFLYLIVLTALALLLLWMLTAKNDPAKNSVSSTLLLPDISRQINNVSRVEIVSAGNNTIATMVKIENRWQLEQMRGYHADWSRLQTLLAALAQASVLEPKTDNPEYYARLGVENITAEDAGGVLVRLSTGDRTTGVLIGHQAQGRPGQYVRLQHSVASALVDRRLDVSTRLLDWADSGIVDISASEVAEVEIIHPRGKSLLVTRISADQTDFDLVGLPQDREIKNSWAVNSIGSVLSMLNFESVHPAGNFDWSDAVKMRLLMFSGMEIMADMMDAGGEYLLRLHADYPAANIVDTQLEGDGITDEQRSIELQAVDDVMKSAEDINQKVVGWVYGISKQKFDVMVNKQENLLKPLEPQ